MTSAAAGAAARTVRRIRRRIGRTRGGEAWMYSSMVAGGCRVLGMGSPWNQSSWPNSPQRRGKKAYEPRRRGGRGEEELAGFSSPRTPRLRGDLRYFKKL